jgi:hypothetical protein
MASNVTSTAHDIGNIEGGSITTRFKFLSIRYLEWLKTIPAPSDRLCALWSVIPARNFSTQTRKLITDA